MKMLQDKIKDSHKTQAVKIQHLEKELHKAQTASPDPDRKRSAPTIPLSPSKKAKTEATTNHPAPDAYLHPSSQRPLQTNAPTSGHHASITKWLKTLQHTMSPEDAKHMDKYIDSVSRTWASIDNTKRPDPQDLAAQWGLPCKDAVNYNEPSLIKVSAAAAWMVAHHTA